MIFAQSGSPALFSKMHLTNASAQHFHSSTKSARRLFELCRSIEVETKFDSINSKSSVKANYITLKSFATAIICVYETLIVTQCTRD